MSNKQIRKMRVILILLIIAWMVIIFLFSMQNINQSTSLSTSVMYVIAKLIQPFTHMDTKEYIYYHFGELTWWIRKSAHVFIFLVLSSLIGLLLMTFPSLSSGKASILTVCIGLICASIDEGHQLLIAGRSGNVFDIGIDMIGVILGIIIALCLYDLFVNKR
ncbi:MAG: VanZ family protein [Erysipelotrichaceae bacterium]|nr:VanZ family protein [Erysipelotrichaceae bacterium]